MTPEARAARERKQKIFVVVGGIFLLGMLAIQLPKLLGGSGESTAAPTPVEGAQPGKPANPTPVVLTETSGRGPAVPGKLTSLKVFRPKNPFVQLAFAEDAPTGDAPAGEGGKKGDAGSGEPKEFSLGKTPLPAVTIVSVNGSRHTLEPGTTFPASDPVFVLVSEQPGAKTAVVGVVGGAYAGGSKTTKLKVGKPLTLVNTTTGAKYRISLVSVGSGDEPKTPEPAK